MKVNENTSIDMLKDVLINKNFWPVDKEMYNASINFILIGYPQDIIKDIIWKFM